MTSATAAAATAEGRNLELERARVHGFIYGVLWEPGRPGRELTWEDLDGALLDPDAVLWLHFNAANAHAREWLSQCPRLPEALRRFLLDRDDRKQNVAGLPGLEDRSAFWWVILGMAGVVLVLLILLHWKRLF